MKQYAIYMRREPSLVMLTGGEFVEQAYCDEHWIPKLFETLDTANKCLKRLDRTDIYSTRLYDGPALSASPSVFEFDSFFNRGG